MFSVALDFAASFPADFRTVKAVFHFRKKDFGMTRRLRLFVLSLCFPFASLAEPVIGDTLSVSIGPAIIDDLDPDPDSAWSFSARGEYFLTDIFYAHGRSDYLRVSLGSGFQQSAVSSTQLLLGPGAEIPISSSFGLFAELGAGTARFNGFSASDSTSDSELLLGGSAGIRARADVVYLTGMIDFLQYGTGDDTSDSTQAIGSAEFEATEDFLLGGRFLYDPDGITIFGVQGSFLF